ncbi:hypothetical protein [Actinoplanes siamensis]|uniref:Uncharacterized protein n=1 Tax=Actinoplanes siamensis TaxID=1223317 RepID=A0A919NB55_9ACTN|nr:hypothetical protein [Actinoplanes siamensis]GIF07544.1 hypothetical protein Asi03nite_50820 [Actinoplanes siamensis]
MRLLLSVSAGFDGGAAGGPQQLQGGALPTGFGLVRDRASRAAQILPRGADRERQELVAQLRAGGLDQRDDAGETRCPDRAPGSTAR